MGGTHCFCIIQARHRKMNSFKKKLSPELERKIIKYFDEAQEVNESKEKPDFESTETYNRISKSIGRTDRAEHYAVWRFKAAAVAAVLVLSIAAAVLFLNQTSMQVKTAAPGTLTKITLPDSTEIWLNADSKISYPDRFAQDKREVSLEGEAYFKVKRNEKKPFLIHTQGIVTKVLGTSFNISSYPDENQIKVTVLTGKVAIYKKPADGEKLPQRLYLTANQQGVYDKNQKTSNLSKKDVKSINSVAWKEGNLIFKDTELPEVIRRLERRYAIRIEIDSTINCPVTVNFKNETLQSVMRILPKLVNGDIKYHDGHYQLTSVQCQ